MRIGGLASGMDIDSIVKNLMQAERMPLQKLQQDKQRLEWQRDDYRTINTLMMDFRSTLTQMKLSTSFRANSVSSSNDALITATASSAAQQGSYSISRVDQMAKAETWVSGTVTDFDPTKPMGEQDSTGITWSSGAIGSQTLKGDDTDTLQLTLNGSEINTAELSKMRVKVNNEVFEVISDPANFTAGKNEVAISSTGELTFSKALDKDVNVRVDYIANEHNRDLKLASGATIFNVGKKMINENGFNLQVGTSNYQLNADVSDRTNVSLMDGGTAVGSVNLNTGEVKLNTAVTAETDVKATFQQNYSSMAMTSHTSKGEVRESFLFDSSQTMNQIFNMVNTSNLGVSMFMDSFTNKISVMRTETGDFNSGAANLSFENGFATDILQLGANGERKVAAQNAKFTVNGLETERPTNTFSMNGITFTLKNEFTTGPAVTMNVNNDTGKVFDNIKGFVEKYNTMIAAINEKVNEERFRDFNPLSDEEREALTDKQQEQFEEKARSGLLRRDSILTGTLSAMRMDFYTPVSNNETNLLFSQLASIGITTTSNFREGGKLVINEAKLKEALSNDPEAVENLFKSGSNAGEDGAKGILHRLTDTVNTTMDELRRKAGNQFSTNQQFSIGRNLNDVDDRIKRFEDRMIQVEDRYWRQFTAMEKAIQQANNQSAYLMQQFSSGF
ncbi:flagellar hook protein [Jeotgalibacillus malaysiensis]|uniref:Flagellar hook-associated protein 2 n=1 Tax=Jeotgalibacillus malaysiensis TaxID=1508404 RepID=A0A0B5ATT8_9BACL|nr:flagellar filament capping protein FliD [Jeotgalibacillus malaysiensis]AJD92132.1 flagellar hook protein [Jeotgalibacillus malaysiensis]